MAIDFDGVIHRHVSKWTVPHEIHDGPVDGAFEFLERVLEEFDVAIFSARAADPRAKAAMCDWLVKHWGASGRAWGPLINGLTISAQKPHAFIYIDDRGWHFEGTFPTMEELRSFESWTKRVDATSTWPLCKVCGKGAREGKHATDLGEGHDYQPYDDGAPA